MKIAALAMPCLAGSLALVVLGPRTVSGYATTGESLSLAQRTVRVFDDFSAAQANNNTTPDPDWPGFTGAELAIWKAATEWGSALHGGTGNGDPTQPGDLGSGNANFDAYWVGNASSVGSANSNTHSEISGSSGGVFAFTETPTGDGWRIRYYGVWTWQDGPGPEAGGVDLQGIATHEYGHALGLGHSTVPGSTMAAGTSPIEMRSIEPDDVSGIQAIYGIKSPAKAAITGLALTTSSLTIQGQNFSPTGNEVWFTPALGTAGGNVTNVLSTGSSIVLPWPIEDAGPGDVLVKRVGTSGADLTNAWPFDPCVVGFYCTAKVNSVGQLPSLSFSGSTSLARHDLHLVCANGGLPFVNGIHFWSDVGPAALPFLGGTLCAQPPVTRGALHVYSASGVVDVPIPVAAGDVGKTRWFQFWFRDAGHPDGTGTGLSGGAQVTFCQ
jgi:hypothetical protein